MVPKPNYKPKQILTEAQLDTFLNATREDQIWHDFFYAELTTGLRRGEICGLQWQDFDADAGTLKISRTLHAKKGGGFVTGATKTGKGKRKIILPHSTAELLRKRQKTSISEWIFPNPVKPELPTSPGSAYRRLKALLKKAGLPNLRFHDLRHTYVTFFDSIFTGFDEFRYRFTSDFRHKTTNLLKHIAAQINNSSGYGFLTIFDPRWSTFCFFWGDTIS